jgi:hypothetical protein
MAEKWELTQASQRERMEALKKDLFEYIDENIQKIDTNLPVFFGHVISRLDEGFPNIDDVVYDEFIDAIAFYVMDKSPGASDVEMIERISSNAIRAKRKSKGKAILNILAGLKLMKLGKFQEAITYFDKYWKYDALIGFYIAFCYSRLADKERKLYSASAGKQPSEMELASREQLIELSRIQPPAFRLKQLEIKDNRLMDQAFWYMISRSLEWFPTERWFIQIGLDKAKRDKNEAMKQKLLKFATEQFYNDLFFMRELFNYRLEHRDGTGASGVVKQMMQQHPQSNEPIYYGIKLSLLSTGKSSYATYREMAQERNMPKHLLQLFDFAYLLMKDEELSATVELKDMKKQYPALQYYLISLEYLMHDIFSDDEHRSRTAKKAFLDSIDRYALHVLKVQDT